MNFKINEIIDSLWNWVVNFKGHHAIKDSTKISTAKFDCFLESSISDPLAFTVFEMNDKGELIVDDVSRLVDSEASFFLFVNTKAGWIIAVRNTHSNIKKLIKGEKVSRFKVQIVP